MIFELYVFTYDLHILRFVQSEQSKVSTLEEDMALLRDEAIEFEMRMAVTYRSERKKILRSQIALVMKTIDVLHNC